MESVVGEEFGGGEGFFYGVYEHADAQSFDGLLGAVGLPIIALELNSSTMSQIVRNESKRLRKVRYNDRYGELDVMVAFDAFI